MNRNQNSDHSQPQLQQPQSSQSNRSNFYTNYSPPSPLSGSSANSSSSSQQQQLELHSVRQYSTPLPCIVTRVQMVDGFVSGSSSGTTSNANNEKNADCDIVNKSDQLQPQDKNNINHEKQTSDQAHGGRKSLLEIVDEELLNRYSNTISIFYSDIFFLYSGHRDSLAVYDQVYSSQ